MIELALFLGFDLRGGELRARRHHRRLLWLTTAGVCGKCTMRNKMSRKPKTAVVVAGALTPSAEPGTCFVRETPASTGMGPTGTGGQTTGGTCLGTRRFFRARASTSSLRVATRRPFVGRSLTLPHAEHARVNSGCCTPHLCSVPFLRASACSSCQQYCLSWVPACSVPTSGSSVKVGQVGAGGGPHLTSNEGSPSGRQP